MPPISGASDLREDLATELFALVRQALERLDVDPATQERAFERSRREGSPVSGRLMRETWGLASVLTEWTRAKDYQDANGQAKILKIHGAGATFESLVARFLPERTVEEVLESAKQTAEIAILPRDRIALVGGILANISAAKQTLLAHTVRQLDMLLGTLGFNAGLADEERASQARLERMVLGVIRKTAFAEFQQALKPQIYNLLLQFDSTVEQHTPRDATEVKDATTVVIGVYVAEESDWERTGVDPRATLPKL